MTRRSTNSTDALGRRRVLQCICGLSAGVASRAFAQTGGSPQSQPPADNDWLVFAYGERAGTPIVPADLELNGQQTFAFPQDPMTGLTRDGTRLNQIIVVRIDPMLLAEKTLERSVEGVVAYSGVCSHTGCDVTDWHADMVRFQCPCHESQFDPSDGARVVGGPAPWQLAALPLKLVDGKLAAAGEFEGRLGFLQPGLDPFGLGN